MNVPEGVPATVYHSNNVYHSVVQLALQISFLANQSKPSGGKAFVHIIGQCIYASYYTRWRCSRVWFLICASTVSTILSSLLQYHVAPRCGVASSDSKWMISGRFVTESHCMYKWIISLQWNVDKGVCFLSLLGLCLKVQQCACTPCLTSEMSLMDPFLINMGTITSGPLTLEKFLTHAQGQWVPTWSMCRLIKTWWETVNP